MTINEEGMSKISGVVEEPIKVDDKDVVSALLPPPPANEPVVGVGQKKEEIIGTELSKVSGGIHDIKMKAVETKNSKFVLVPEDCTEFDTIEEANKKIGEMKEHKPLHAAGFGPMHKKKKMFIKK